MIGMVQKIKRNLLSFYFYQSERFPIIILSLSLFPAILSSGIIVSDKIKLSQVIGAFIVSIAYLFHIRVIDEYRDFDHDNLYHGDRPLQAGLISKKKLYYIDLVSVCFLFITAGLFGKLSFLVAIFMFCYSYLAGKEFFVGKKIRQHFFIYNAVNLIQMLLMQILVYTIFVGYFSFNFFIFTHFLFTTSGTIIFEFIRKLKIPGHDGLGRDTYTSFLGFNKSLFIYQILLFCNTLFFFYLSYWISPKNVFDVFIFTFFSFIFVSFFIFLHKIKKTHKTDQLMQLTFLLLYGIFNLIIFFIK